MSGADITQVGDGVAALEHLRDPATSRPDLIVLDLNMPRMNGGELLGVLKTDEDLRSIPVVVLTTSSAPGDVMGAYRRHASAYVTKPIDLEDSNARCRASTPSTSTPAPGSRAGEIVARPCRTPVGGRASEQAPEGGEGPDRARSGALGALHDRRQARVARLNEGVRSRTREQLRRDARSAGRRSVRRALPLAGRPGRTV